MGAVGVYTPWQTENKLSNAHSLTSFLLMCLTNSHCYERSVPPCGKGVTGGKEGQWRCLTCKHWAYDQQCLHWTTNLCFAFQAEQQRPFGSQIITRTPRPACLRTDQEEQSAASSLAHLTQPAVSVARAKVNIFLECHNTFPPDSSQTVLWSWSCQPGEDTDLPTTVICIDYN